MLSVPIHKDFTEYKPKVVGGFTSRTLICLAGGIVSAIMVAALLVGVIGLSISAITWVIWLVAIPFFLVGFYKPFGLEFEKFAALYFSFKKTPQRLFYVSQEHRVEEEEEVKQKQTDKRKSRQARKRDKEYNKARKLHGIEAYYDQAL